MRESGTLPINDTFLHEIPFVLVEAKYLSGKSSEADEGDLPSDQLAKEWDDLVIYARQENAKPILLYITADLGFPSKDIDEAYQDFARSRGSQEMNIIWISWRKLPALFSNTNHRILRDLAEVLNSQGLKFFEGIKMPSYTVIRWSFKVELMHNWDWSSVNAPSVRWIYDVRKIFNFRCVVHPVKWRFLE